MKIGDRVICIDASKKYGKESPDLIKGREYIIYGIRDCVCGIMSFDVGLSRPTGDSVCSCYRRLETTIHYCHSNKFRKVEEKHRVIRISEEILEEEINLN